MLLYSSRPTPLYTYPMTLTSKKVSLVLLFILSLILSRTVFWFIDDPEGPNLLIVTVLAIIIYACLLGLYKLCNYFK